MLRSKNVFSQEGELYPYILKYLIEKYNLLPNNSGFTYSKGVDKETAKSLILRHRGIRVEPDVFGVNEDGIVLLAEGKVQCGGTNLDTAIGQAVTYQRFSHFAYVFFPDTEFINSDLLDYVQVTLKHHGLGLLTVSSDGTVNELIKPQLSPFLQVMEEKLFLNTFNQIVTTKVSLTEIDPFNDDNAKELERGPRAFLIRDFCVWFSNNESSMREESLKKLAMEFESWMVAQIKKQNRVTSNYWTAQFAGAKTELQSSRSLAAVYGSIYFEMVERKPDYMTLTDLGKSLVLISSNIGIPELSIAERAFFYALAWKSPSARRLILIMTASKGKVNLYKNKCGHRQIMEVDGKPKCMEEDRFIEYEDLSIAGRLNYEYNEDISYYKKTFWLRSEIFTICGLSTIEYKPVVIET